MQPSSSGNLVDSVLVVDDDVNFHRLAETALGQAGISCVCVRSGEEALRLCGGSVPRAVLVDGLLPGLRGDEVARRLRQQYSADLLPIVFISAFYRDMKSYKLLTQDCGVDLVIHKPVAPDVLRRSVEKILKVEEVAVPLLDDLPSTSAASDDGIDVDMEEAAEEEEAPSAEMVQLIAEYLANSKERAVELRAALRNLGGGGAEDALHFIRVESHRFRGSGASFGFPEISRLGGSIEELILDNDGLLRSGPLLAKLNGLVEALADKVLAAAGAAPIPLHRVVGGARPRILLVDGGSGLARNAGLACEAGEPIDAVGDVDSAVELAIEKRPDVVFLAGDSGELDAAVALRRFRMANIGPVVLIARSDALSDWVNAIQAGATGYVARPPDVESLFRIAGTFARPRIGARVLAVGADRSSLSKLSEALAPRGVAIEPCATAEEFFASLDRAAPAMVLLDGDLQKVKGLDLLRVLRADLQYRQLPVVVLSQSAKLDERVAAYEAGAVDFLMRPFTPDELASRVVVQLARQGGSMVSRGRDPVTGVFDREYLREATTRALQLARREGRTLSLLAIDARVDGLQKELGRLAADEVVMGLGMRLLAAFRTSDVVARIAPGRLCALLHGAGKADAERLLATELKELRGRTFSGGYKPDPVGAVVSFPELGGGVDAMLEALEAKLVR